MRIQLFIVCGVLGAASIAHADPGPSLLASAGVQAGGNDGLMTGGGAVELDKRVAGGLWLHSTFAAGSTAMWFIQGSGDYEQLRAGVEARGCGTNGFLCLFVGLDGGLQHAAFDGMDTLSKDYLEPMVVPRLGFDAGGKVRFRPSLEVPITPEGAGVAVTMAVAVDL